MLNRLSVALILNLIKNLKQNINLNLLLWKIHSTNQNSGMIMFQEFLEQEKKPTGLTKIFMEEDTLKMM